MGTFMSLKWAIEANWFNYLDKIGEFKVMSMSCTRPPTWSKVDPDGTRFVTYDGQITPIQLQTLDKIVENIELFYDSKSRNQPLEISDSYIFKKPNESNEIWHWRNSSDRKYFKSQLPKSKEPQPPITPGLIYNCYSRETSGQMRAYLSRIYDDLVKIEHKPWPVIDDEEKIPPTVRKNSILVNTPPSPFPKIIPLPSPPRSIIKPTSKYEQKLLDVYSDITDKRRRLSEKNDQFGLDDDVFEDEKTADSGITSRLSNSQRDSPDLDRPLNEKIKANDDTDLDQDVSTSSAGIQSSPKFQHSLDREQSFKTVSGFVKEQPESRNLMQRPQTSYQKPLDEFRSPTVRELFDKEPAKPRVQINPGPSYYPSFGQNNPTKPQTPSAKSHNLTENADRLVENINKRFQPSKTQLGRIKDVSSPPQVKMKFLHNFSSKFIDKANKIQHKR